MAALIIFMIIGGSKRAATFINSFPFLSGLPVFVILLMSHGSISTMDAALLPLSIKPVKPVL